MLIATGWAGFAASVRDLENTETVGKIKEGTVTIIDKSMDGLSKVSERFSEKVDRRREGGGGGENSGTEP